MANIGMKEAQALKKSWRERLKQDPDLKCDHPLRYYKEKYLGQDTGDRVCPVCGDIKWFKKNKHWVIGFFAYLYAHH